MRTARITYAGIGARHTPPDVLALMHRIAGALAQRGWVLRTGGAPGADQAFAAGARDAGGTAELFLPWPGFEHHTTARLTRPTARALELAARHHPAWHRLRPPTRALLARNGHQVLGADLEQPAHVVICWTPDGSLTGQGAGSGGTGQALRIAHANDVAVVNLARPTHRTFAHTFLTRP